MAVETSSTVELIFLGVDKTAEATQAALSNAQKFSSTVQNIAAPIADATTAAIKFEAAILGAGAAVTAFAISAAGDFDQAFRELMTIFEIPADQIEGFRNSILDYAKVSTQSLEQITASLYTAASGGVVWSDSLALLSEAEKLSVAGKADLNSVTKVLIDTIRAYGEDIDQAGQYSDVFFKTVKEGQITIPQLAENLAKVTQTAATLGVPIEEVGAAIAALTGQGVNVSEAFTQVNAILSAFIKPTSQAEAIAKELNITFDATTVQSMGLYEALQYVYEATGGSEEAMARLFGRMEATKGLFSLTGDAADFYASKLEGVRDSAGATEEAFAEMAGAISLSNQTLSNSLKVLLIEIGDPLLEEYGNVTKAIAAVFNALGANVKEGELGGLVEFIRTILADTAGLFNQFAENLPGALDGINLSGFQGNIEEVLRGLKNLFGAVDISTEDGLRTLIENVGAGFLRLGTFVGDALTALGPFLTMLLQIGETIVGVDEKWFALAGRIGGTAIILDTVLPKLDSLLLLLIAARGFGIAGGATAAAGAVDGLGLNIKTLAGILAAAGVGYAIGTYLVDPLDQAVDRLTGSGSLGGAIYDLQEQFQNSTTGISGFANLLAGVILDWVSGTDDLGDATRRAEAELAAMNAQWGTVEEVAARAAEATRRAAEEYGQITDNTAEANDALREFAESQGFIINEFGRWVELKKPLSEIAPVFDDINDATGNWIRTTVDGVETFSQRVGGAIDDVVSTTKSYESASGGTLSVVASQFATAGDAAEDAFKKTDAYFLKMMELASNEKIALIEAKVSLDIAEVEANAEIVVAAFDSINNSISESYALLGDLFGLWADTDSAWDKAKLESFIKEEQRRLDKELELQAELVRAQIELIKAKTDAMYRGDAMIQIDGAGLQPHLEGFMWEILRTIQTRVNQDGLEMLLGTPA
jgi:TP901 family phage tail tape measure protein